MAKKLKQTTKSRIIVAGIVIISLIMGFFVWPSSFDRGVDFLNNKLGTTFPHFKNVPFHLGLDLQGGTHLVYEADTSKIPFGDRAESVEGVRDVIERRVNAFGVAEPLVQVNKGQTGYRVIVDLAGVKDVKKAIQMIGETPLLEFKEQNPDVRQTLNDEEKKNLTDFNQKAQTKANDFLTEALSSENFSEVLKQFSELESVKDTNGDLGWVSQNSMYNFLWEEAVNVEVGKVIPKVIEQTDGYFVAMVTDRRDNGEEVNASHILVCYEGASACQDSISKEEAWQKITELKEKLTTENFAEMAKENSTDLGSGQNGGDLGWFSHEQMVKPFSDMAFSISNGEISEPVESDFGYHIIYKKDSRKKTEYKLTVGAIKKMTEAEILAGLEQWRTTALTGKDLVRASVEFSPQTGQPEVSLEFNETGKTLFAEITSRNVGKPVAIFLDGTPISTPVVNESITDGKAVISGTFDLLEAKTLSNRLNAGALPVPINLISQQTVGASLGSDSLQKSLFAGLVGFLAVIVFMVVYYRRPGLFASISLIIYGVIVLTVFKLVPVTVTLSGVAGFILSLGMAVDANVLIFERLKEELKTGKPLATAIDESFRRAWSAIRDGNYTTLIVCFVLAWLGSGVIKGFAITLGIGILASMFSAMVITKHLLNISKHSEKKSLWCYGVCAKKEDK